MVWSMDLPMSSHRNTEFMNYINSHFVTYYKHKSSVQQYIDMPLVKPIEKYFNGLASDVVTINKLLTN